MTDDAFRCVTIRLSATSDPMAGEMLAKDLPPRRFQGWLELIRALEALRDGPSDDERDAAG